MQTTSTEHGGVVERPDTDIATLKCIVCGSQKDLSRCSRCREALYCGKDHQRQDWPYHKQHCRPLSEGNQAVKQLNGFTPTASTSASIATASTSTAGTLAENALIEDTEGSAETEVLSSGEQSLGGMPQFAPEQAVWPPQVQESPDGRAPYMHHNVDETDDPFREICSLVIADMNRYGMCVLDDFLGRERASLVMHEFMSLYQAGLFQEGQLVKGKVRTESRTVRGDQIMWTDGKLPETPHIGYLIHQVDSIIMRANRMSNNGVLGRYSINGRTKAMLACYPGCGSHYVKHVDNPNMDGRCITAIYYLNKDWDVDTQGGLLRIFPFGWVEQVANIAPLLDRILFFWSDRRNPHEVQPAYSTRYAITLWYFDAAERARAIRRFKQSQPSTSSNGQTSQSKKSKKSKKKSDPDGEAGCSYSNGHGGRDGGGGSEPGPSGVNNGGAGPSGVNNGNA